MKNSCAMMFLALAMIVDRAPARRLGRFNPGTTASIRVWRCSIRDRFRRGGSLFRGRNSEEIRSSPKPIFISGALTSARASGARRSNRCAPRSGFRRAQSQQEIMNLIVDATFAAALNDFKLGGGPTRSLTRSKEILYA